MKEKLFYFFKKYHLYYIILIAGFFAVQILLYETSKIINDDWNVINMKIDEYIPFCKYFIIFYFTYYFFPPIQLYLMSYTNKRKFYKVLISAVISVVVCNICFWIYQVKMERPEIVVNDAFDYLVQFIYNMDKGALNCCPSIHAVMGTLMIIAGYKTEKFPNWFQGLSLVFGAGCIVSTVFIKQHYFIDIVLGVLIMSASYLLVTIIDKKIIRKNEEKQKDL